MLAILSGRGTLRACPIHSTLFRRQALARKARAKLLRWAAKLISCIRFTNPACLSTGESTMVNVTVVAGLRGSLNQWPIGHWRVLAPTWIFTSFTSPNKPNQTKRNMKSSDYYITRALRLARLPQSKNVARLRTANHRAMGDARRNELAKLTR